MSNNKLFEENELQKRSKHHKKRQRGMSPFDSLNPDAGNVEHNISMFNQAMSTNGGPCTSPNGCCEDLDTSSSDMYQELHYSDLEISIVTRAPKSPSYFFRYGYDEGEVTKETISYDYTVLTSDVVECLAELLTENDMENIDNATDAELISFATENIDTLMQKYESEVLDNFRDLARSSAEREHRNNSLFESALDNEYIIMGIRPDGTKEYYNRSSVPHWVAKGSEATIFDDMDEARAIWFDIDKKPFKRVFIPNYDHKLMNEATEVDTYDKMRLADILYDRVDVLLSMYLDEKYQIIPHGIDAWKINTKTGSKILTVSIDRENPTKDITFTIDGKNTQTVKTEVEAAKIIDSIARRKYVKSFDVAVESVREDWTPGDDWVSYKGAWIYPVSGGYEANFMGQHFEGTSIDELKIKITNARAHTQKFVGAYEKAVEFENNIKKFGREIEESIADGRCLESFEDGRQVSNELYRVYDHALELLHDGANADVVKNIERAFESIGGEGFVKAESSTYIKYKGYIPWEGHEEYVIQGSISMGRLNADFNMLAEDITMAYYRTKLDGKLYSTPELMRLVRDHKEVKLHDVQEGWSPDMTDCPACGDSSFDSKRGRCTKCSYRECYDSGVKSLGEWLEFSEDDFEDDQMHANVYGGDSKYCKDCGSVKSYDEDGFAFCPECAKIESFDESVEYVKWVLMPDGEWKMWGSNPDDKLDPTFLDRARKRNNIEYLDAKVVKNGESPETTSTKETLDEASYGGAYDIANDQYFTREELNSFADRVVSELNDIFNDTFNILDASIDAGILSVEVEGNELGWYMDKVKIDMRKIKTPTDLERVYAPEMIGKLSRTIKDYNGI